MEYWSIYTVYREFVMPVIIDGDRQFHSLESEKLQLFMVVSGYNDDQNNFKVQNITWVLAYLAIFCCKCLTEPCMHFVSEGDLGLCPNCRADEKILSLFRYKWHASSPQSSGPTRSVRSSVTVLINIMQLLTSSDIYMTASFICQVQKKSSEHSRLTTNWRRGGP